MRLPRLLRLSLALTLTCNVFVFPASAAAATRADHRVGPAAAPSSLSEGRQTEFVPGEVLVRFDQAVARDATRKQGVHMRAGGSRGRRVGQDPSLERVTLAKGVSVDEAIAAYDQQAGVVSVQPNYVRRLAALPTDPRFSNQWGMHNTGQPTGVADADVDAPEAWVRETGSSDVIVAVIDSGVDYTHPDLIGNMWVNHAEQHGVAGVDDDGNGYVDDIHGIDATLPRSNNGAAVPAGDPMDDDGHGTHAAGTIGAAAGNGVGIAGLNRDVSIMAIKAFGFDGGTDADVIAAIQYATAMGADIVSCSWGGYAGQDGDALHTAIKASPALFSCAAGNDAVPNDSTLKNLNLPGNPKPFTPASYTLPNIISVAASGRSDTLASFSNYSATGVDLAAPGVGVYSTTVGEYDGTGFFDDFSQFDPQTGALLNWTVTGGWRTWYFNASPPEFFAGNIGYGGNRHDIMRLDRDDLWMGGNAVAYVEFSILYDLEPNADFVRLEASRDGGATWDVLKEFTGTGGKQVRVDLVDYAASATQPIQFRFDLDSDASDPAGEVYGASIDDFRVFYAPTTERSYTYSYEAWDGTSMAAPFVSGAAALLKAHSPSLTTAQMKKTLLDTVDTKAAFSGKVLTAGRLNVNRALARLDGDVPGRVTRVSGTDRFAVAEAMARRSFPDWEGVDHVIVACGDDGKEADPLTAAGLAGVYNAPVLLTRTTVLPSATRRVITEAAAACMARGTKLKVHIVGGKATVPDARWNEIAAISGVSKVKDRIAGADRYAVSAAIANRMISVAGTSSIEGAIIVNAENPAAFYDALAASPIAFARTMPMLAVKKSSVPSGIKAVLSGPLAGKPLFSASGPSFVSDTIVTSRGATRLAKSADRYTAAAQIAHAAVARKWLKPADTAIAAKLPDALTGGVFMGARDGVLLFTESARPLAAATDRFVTERALEIDSGWVLGGTVSVPSSVEAAYRSRIH